MTHMLLKRTWFLLLFFSLIAGCYPLPESKIYESEGIVSITVDSSNVDNKWQVAGYNTSNPMLLRDSGESKASFRIYIQTPGSYTLWFLSAKKLLSVGEEPVFISVTDGNGFLHYQGRFMPDNDKYLRWNQLTDSSEPINFEQPGFYEISFHFINQEGFLLQKIHLTKNNEDPPTGFGLPETTEPDIDPVLVKRQQAVMLPPAWAFGLMVWPEDNVESVIDSLMSKNIRMDAVIEQPMEKTTRNHLPSTWKSEDQIFSVNITGNSGENYINDDVSFADERPFLLSGMQNVYNPSFKKLPAKWVSLLMDTAESMSVSEILQKHIELVSNPLYAASEAPFTSSGLNASLMNAVNGDMSDEMLKRWIQFSALTSLMHLYIPESSRSDLFSNEVMQEIREMTQLRYRLFPYLYSLAHLVRASAENPVRGDGEHAFQFRLGEAFLVAPVYREGEESRTVWLPEGTWYDYWTGEQYEGEQTWLVDASENDIPLFVKAGSIIPTRSHPGYIIDGSNQYLTVNIFAGGVGTFRLYEDDGVTNRYRDGEIATTGFRYFETDEYATFTVGKAAGLYDGLPEERKLILKFLHISKPKQVRANSNRLQEGDQNGKWIYDEESETLTVQWNQPTGLKTDFEIRF